MTLEQFLQQYPYAYVEFQARRLQYTGEAWTVHQLSMRGEYRLIETPSLELAMFVFESGKVAPTVGPTEDPHG